jgi:hypothetical protein
MSKAFFFKGGQYARYDVDGDKTDVGYPLAIAGNWPGLPFTDGIDDVVLWNNGKAFFFKGSQYACYDMAGDKADDGYPLPIAGNWPGLPFTDGIDAAVLWNNGKAFFFKGSHYARYDVAGDKTDDGYPLSIAGNWPGLPFTDGIDAVVLWNNGKAFFFKGSQYARYDLAGDKTDDGYPLPIAGNWPGLPFTDGIEGLALWATTPRGGTVPLVYEDKVTENRTEFIAKVRSICDQLSIKPDWLMAMMNHESGLNHRIQNPNGGATGLIQFMPDTAQRLGTSTEALRAMTNVEQLDYVYRYFLPYRGRVHNYSDLYLVTFYPYALGRSDDFVFGSERSPEWAKKVRDQNAAIDLNGDGAITLAEFRQWVFKGIPASIRDRIAN